jgi:hypothetical protein
LLLASHSGALVAIDVAHFAELRDSAPNPRFERILFEVVSTNTVHGRFSATEADTAQAQVNADQLLRVRDVYWNERTMRLCGPLTLAVGDAVFAPSWDAYSNALTSALYAAEVIKKPTKQKNKTYVVHGLSLLFFFFCSSDTLFTLNIAPCTAWCACAL